jgi:nucleoside-diphosphate-sugar epimerase
MKSIILFGGCGFVGNHLARMIARQKSFNKIYLADIKTPKETNSLSEYVRCDVRKPIEGSLFPEKPSCIVNLAAIHTSPGHPAHEYFEANILGARNVCACAESLGVDRIFFTSSISVYGPGEDEKTEGSVQMPNIAYGSSKAIAEYIHREWFFRDEKKRMLSIVRPGVIFGMGEGGNFTRIANALEKGFFPLPGRIDTIKACLYVKDLCRFILQKASEPETSAGYSLYNFCLPEKVSIGDVVETFKQSLGYRAWTPLIPLRVINMAAAVLGALNVPIVRKMGMVPERIVKLVRSTNISSRNLVDSGFVFKYHLDEALKDWSEDCGGKHLY